MSPSPGARRIAGLVAAAALSLTVVGAAGCAPTSKDQPPFTLSDAGALTQSAVIESAAWPTATFGSGELFFQRFDGSTPYLYRYKTSDGSEERIALGYRPSACDAGLYFFDGDSLAYLAPATTQPVDTGIQGYDYVLASPGNLLLLLAREKTQAEGGGIDQLFIADAKEGIVRPFTAAGTYEPEHPSWDGDTSLLVDALSAEGSTGPRNAYRIAAGGEGIQAELVKLGVTSPLVAGSTLACLEEDAGDGMGEPALCVYDLESRVRIAVTEPGADAAFGRMAWLAEDALAVEATGSDQQTSIRIYTLSQ